MHEKNSINLYPSPGPKAKQRMEEMSTEHSPTDSPSQQSPRLPPPPYWSGSTKVSQHGLYVPLPPCPFQPLARSSHRIRRFRREEDPFLAAYLECTKSTAGRRGKASKESKRGGGLGSGFGFSCKHVCDVVEDGIVRPSQLPSLPARERFLERRWRQRNIHGHGSLYQ